MKKYIYIGIIVVVLIPVLYLGSAARIWIRCALYSAPIPFSTVVSMKFRGAPIGNLVTNYIAARKVGIDVSISQLENHAAAGGNVDDVVESLIEANRASILVDFALVSNLDLAPKRSEMGVVELIRACSEPRVVQCPPKDSTRDYLEVVTGDGVLLQLRIKATIVPNLQNYAGGATEETLVARISSMMIERIGSLQNYQQALNNPSAIDRAVLQSQPDAGTAWKILSIDTSIWKAQ